MELLSYNSQDVKKAVEALSQGKVVAHPADTCFGFAADLMNEEAVKNLQAMKKRPTSNPMSVMFPAIMKNDLEGYVKLDEFSRRAADLLFPGPITILFPKGPAVPSYYYPDSSLIGIRIPYDALTQDLLMGFKGPLITTSANISSNPPCISDGEVVSTFGNEKLQPAYVFEGLIKDGEPSTVIELLDEDIAVRREGPMPESQIRSILRV